MKPNILILTSRYPHSPERGDKLWFSVRSVRYDIHLISIARAKLSPGNYEAVKAGCKNDRVVLPESFHNSLRNYVRNLFRTSLADCFLYTKAIVRKIRAVSDREKPALNFCQLLRVSEF